MKRNEWMSLIVTTFLMFAICLSASAKGKKTVERGITKQEVMTILGQPKLTSFDAYGDRWDYFKQTARMMRQFSFGDKQLKVLSMMAPHIVDLQNAIVIYNVLTFDSEKTKAGEILRNARQ